ncbi:MAG: hypothetical protein RIQ68_2351 [Pseudomonadota bacterium]
MARETRGGKGLCRQHIALGSFYKNRGGRAHHGPPEMTTPHFSDSVARAFAAKTDIHMVSQSNFAKEEFFGGRWCRMRGLNPRPSVYKTAALPLS